MTEMVDRVARAIWAEYRDTDCIGYDQLHAAAKEYADRLARAAIEAMREPTEDMWTYPVEQCEDVWRAMIDAALK